MKSKEKIKYIITTIIIAIFIILSIDVVSEAADEITNWAFKKSNIYNKNDEHPKTKDGIGYNQAGLDRNNTSKEKGLFCIEKGQKLYGGGTKYKLIDIIHIQADGTIERESDNETITNRKTRAKTAAYALQNADDTIYEWYKEDGKQYYRSDKAMIIWNYITGFTNSIKKNNNADQGWKKFDDFDVKGIAKSTMTVSAKKTLSRAKQYANKKTTTNNTALKIEKIGDMEEAYWNNGRYFKISLKVNCKLEDMYISSNITGEYVYDDSQIKININGGNYNYIRDYYDEGYDSLNLAEEVIANKTFDLYIPYDANLTEIKVEAMGSTSISGTAITADIAYLKSLTEDWQNLIAVKTKTKEVEVDDNTETITIKRPIGGLQIEKVDADNSNLKMANVGFKVQNVETGGWVKADSSLGSFEEAKTFMTGVDGKTEVIPNLPIGNYKPVETVNPYSGYGDTNTNLTQYVSAGTTQTVSVISKTNKHVYTSISGYVWVDGEVGKTASMNGTFDNGEGKNGIIVRLWDHRGDILVDEKKTETTIDSNGQTINGKYQFDNVKVDDLQYLHIDFYYDGITYATVNPNPSAYQYNADGTKVFIDAGTKAVENSGFRENLNNKFGNITNNGLGQNSIKINDGVTNDTLGYSRDIANYKSTVSYAGIYPIVAARAGAWKGLKLESDNSVWQSLCNDFSLTERFEEIKAVDPFVANGIENVNLGLKVREKPNMSVLKDIERVKLSINGYNHIYNYNTRYQKYGNNQGGFYDGKTPEEFNVGVKFGNEYGSMAYTRPIYKSDYTYENPKDKSKELQVYITYKIMIYNNTTTLQERN